MKWLLKGLLFLVIALLLTFFLYCNNLSLASKKTVAIYNTLKRSLKEKGYAARLLVISTKRISLHNKIQVKLAGAASKSRHLKGEAIDFLVFDINKDGKTNGSDVEIVYKILDEEIMKGTGGIGTYKNERSFFNNQMVHIDCREISSRWRQ